MQNIFFTSLRNNNNSVSNDSYPISTRPRVLILSGQSNARGQETAASINTIYPNLTSGALANRKVWNGSAFVDIEVDVNTNWPAPNTLFGAELNYSYLINKFWQNNYFDYIIKIAWNATDIAKWLVGGTYHNTFITWVNNALAAIPGDNNDYSVIMYWDQGESDATSPFNEAYAYAYGSRFEQMITDFRANLDVRKLPVVLRKHRIDVGGFPYIYAIINQQEWIINNVADTSLITSDDLDFISDAIHFTGEAQCILGQRLTEKAIYLFD